MLEYVFYVERRSYHFLNLRKDLNSTFFYSEYLEKVKEI